MTTNALSIAAIAIATWTFLRTEDPTPARTTVRCSTLEIVDESDKVRCRIGVEGENVTLSMINVDEREVLKMSSKGENSRLVFKNNYGQDGAVFSYNAGAGGGLLGLYDPVGTPRVMFSVRDLSGCGLIVDRNGKLLMDHKVEENR